MIIPQVAACELLHALILYMIGKSAQPVAQNKVTWLNMCVPKKSFDSHIAFPNFKVGELAINS